MVHPRGPSLRAEPALESIVVPCTRQKVWDTEPLRGPTQARDAYTGAAFRTWRAFAEAADCPWYILSTKYGLVLPELAITNYSVPISEAESDPAFLAALGAQARAFGLDRCTSIVVLDWERFGTLVRRAIGEAGPLVRLHKILY
jgi:hypothetical protein